MHEDTIVGTSVKGRSDTPQGVPPIFAQIWTSNLLQMVLSFPFGWLMVEVRMTWLAIGHSLTR